MKINKERLRELIKEELSYLQQEGYFDSRSWRRERIGIELGGRGSRDEKKRMKAEDIVRYISDKLKENPSSLETHVDYLKELISKNHFTKEHAKLALDKLIELPGIPALKAQFEKIDENFLKKAMAGAAIAGGLMGATPASANKPTAAPATTQVVKQEIKSAREGIAQISDKVMQMNNKFADDSVGSGARSFNLALENDFKKLNHVGSLIKNPKDKDFILKITGNIKASLTKLIGLQKDNKNLKELLQMVETVDNLANSGKI